jgi:nitrogen regulatory protein P-II 1
VKTIEAVIRPSRLNPVKEALSALGVGGMTVTGVHGCGHQPARSVHQLGATHTIDLLAKTKLEVVVPDELVDPVISTICKTARTGSPGDGMVFVLPVESATRIRTGEVGEAAL